MFNLVSNRKVSRFYSGKNVIFIKFFEGFVGIIFNNYVVCIVLVMLNGSNYDRKYNFTHFKNTFYLKVKISLKILETLHIYDTKQE